MRWVTTAVQGALAKAPLSQPQGLLGAAAAVLGPTVVLLILLNRRNRRQRGHPGWTKLRSLRDFDVQEIISDDNTNSDGYTVLLGRFRWQQDAERALIKLKARALRTNPPPPGSTGSRASLLSLLVYMSLRVQLESGAEYGYFRGALSPATLWRAGAPVNYDVEVIAPASERQITRARPEEKFLVRESGDMYEEALKPLIEEIRREGRSIQWVYNILDHKKEVERIVYEDSDAKLGFMLVIDPKWKTHPNPEMVPKPRWFKDPSTCQLSCLAICHDRSIGSLRDLRARHLPLLENILHDGLCSIQEVYGVEAERIRVYVHYLPQFFHFHVHFSRVNVYFGVEVERAHLLSDIIDNLRRDGNYYRDVSMSYAVKRSEEAYKRLQAAGLYQAPDQA